jgi:hypothetical protein
MGVWRLELPVKKLFVKYPHDEAPIELYFLIFDGKRIESS